MGGCLWTLLAPFAATLDAALIQELSATNASSVTTDASGNVSAWLDASGNGNDASPAVGNVIYPASYQFASGLSGLDFGTTFNSLRLLDASKTDALLDFTGAASNNSGFAMVVSVHVDALNSDWNDILGIASEPESSGFGLRFSRLGRIQTYLGDSIFLRDTSDQTVSAGDSVILAVNYNATTGDYQLWDSLNNSIVSWTVPAGDFSVGSDGILKLGHTSWNSRFLIGAIGEVQLYDSALSANEFTNAITDAQLNWATPASPPAFQHLDASEPASVQGDDPVTLWLDQSPNGHDATPDLGAVVYPSTNLFSSGREGMDFGADRNTLELLDVSELSELLDFDGDASSNSGFSVLISARVDELRNDWNDLIGTVSAATNNGFGIRYNHAGVIQGYLGGERFVRSDDKEARVAAGTSVVFAFNYDANTGTATLWDSLNDSEVTWNVAAKNFANAPLTLGSTDVGFRSFSGSVGEVKIFDQKLSAAQFDAARDNMTLRWVGIPPEFPAMPQKPAWTIAQLLDWDPSTDPDAPFNVATVPLQDRIKVPAVLKANPNAKSGQGGIQALDVYAGNLPQGGDGGQDLPAFTYWQYLEESVYWGGIGAINFVPPTGEMIDNAHRNGVPILGTVFFPPLVFGGNFDWVETFLQKDGDSFPAADKLIQTAEYYGFDGWFINQETEGGTPAHAAAMRDLIRYVRENSDIRIMWYDSMREDGVISWQDRLNENNDWYLRHNYTTGEQTADGARIAHGMFTDFIDVGNPPSPIYLDNPTILTDASRSRALTLGLNPYDIFTGQEAEANNFKTSTSPRLKMDNVFPEGQDHITSVGFYKTFKFAQSIPDQDLFWTGASGDPRDTSSTVQTGNWRGVAHNIAARSVINSIPFATTFNLGKGDRYYLNGEVVRDGAWYNRALQSILPTWRWIVDTTGTKLTPELDTGDSFEGGSSLRVSGTLDAANTLRLYLTDLPVEADTKLKIVFKRPGLSSVDSFMQVGLAFADSPTTNTFYDAGDAQVDGWNETIIDLSAHAGSTIRTISLKFEAPTNVAPYEIRVGQLAIFNSSDPIPEQATNIQELDVVNWAGTTSGRVKWDHAASDHLTYDVYLRLTDGSLVFVGSTPNNYYYFDNIALPKEYAGVVVQTVDPAMNRSLFSDESMPTLEIAPAGGTHMRLTWPTLTGATLETREDLLSPPGWEPMTGLSIQDNDGTSTVEVPLGDEETRFFRLTW